MDNGRIIVGIDIGNSNTEAIAVAKRDGECRYLSGAMVPTTGVKGTPQNAEGCIKALDLALKSANLSYRDVAQIRLNQAAPVISDLSMDTVSETTVTGSAMIGHNPDTPGGEGLAVGITQPVENLQKGMPVIAVITASTPFYEAARLMKNAKNSGTEIVGAIVQNDDGVLICNRLNFPIPVVDEVSGIDRVPLHTKTAIEVAGNGQSIKTLSSPYGIAGIFTLSPEETKNAIPVARSLTGCRSGVVIHAENASVKNKKVKAGTLAVISESGQNEIDVNAGSDAIMELITHCGRIEDIKGEPETNTGALFTQIRQSMSALTGVGQDELRIADLLASDTFSSVEVAGGIAGESALENVVMLAAMVETSSLPMNEIAGAVSEKTGIFVKVQGKEAEMAVRGALTTPGTGLPLAVLDLGGGSTDAALIDTDKSITSVHHAGAGEMVTKMIDLELDLKDRETAELIKKYPLAKAESLLFLRFEDGSVKFVSEPLPPDLYSRVVIVTEDGLVPVRSSKKLTVDRIRLVRRESKKKVFLVNAKRALAEVAPRGEIRNIGSVVLVGGSAEDFELADILAEYLSQFRITAGRANLLNHLSPHSAVALGLAMEE